MEMSYNADSEKIKKEFDAIISGIDRNVTEPASVLGYKVRDLVLTSWGGAKKIVERHTGKPPEPHIEEPVDISKLTRIKEHKGISGRYLVNFKRPFCQENDPIPATVAIYKDKLSIHWDNGCVCYDYVENFNFYIL